MSILVPAFGVALLTWFWDALSDGESPSTTIRNIGLILVAATAFPIAVWRGIVADKQATAAHSQAEVALRQDLTAQQGLRNERYQKGAEMLGSHVLSVRLGGIYALQRVATEHAHEYQVQIVDLFCAFARHPTTDEKHEKEVEGKWGFPQIRDDVQAVMQAIGRRDAAKDSPEREGDFSLDLERAFLKAAQLENADLSSANLRKVDLCKANLSKSNLRRVFGLETHLREALLDGAILSDSMLVGADLSSAYLVDADLSGAYLIGTNLSNAKLSEANLSGSILMDTILSRAELSGVRTLTQSQLDQARADPDNPPKLEGAFDAETGQPLVWTGGQGEPLKD